MNEHTILRLGHQGDGIAAGPVHVARALPGEIVAGEVENGRIEAPKILRPSDDRVAAPCPHYRTCGGCALQHARDGFVAGWKVGVVRAALEARGIEAPMRPILTSPPRSRRRAIFSGRRTRKAAVVGFHGRRSDQLTPVPDCLVITDALRALLPTLEALVEIGASRKSELSITVTETESGPDVAVSGGLPLDRDLRQSLPELANQHRLARLTWNGEPIAQRDTPVLRLGLATVAPPPGAFLQATREGEAALLSAVREAVAGTQHVADLFAGCGTFALPLAATAEVHAVEGEAAMMAALDAGWRRTEGLRRLTVETRDLFRRPLVATELARFDAAVIDPPRAGAEAQTAEFAKSAVARIAAVSCNPVTFARDAQMLIGGGYRLAWVQVVDQFRWSPHIELAAGFTRR